MYNLLVYSKNYRKTTGSLQNYYRDELSDPPSSNSKPFKYKASTTGNKNETEVDILLKHLTNLWRTVNIPLSNCEIQLILTWSKNCALADMTVRAAGKNNDPPAIVGPTGLEF